MKIAFVGKGGSGKSSTSWLIIKTLEHLKKDVLAIDADHNMDLTSNLGLDPDTTTLMKNTDKEFMEKTARICDDTCNHIEDNHTHHLPTFSLHDTYTNSISTKITDNLKLINIGLGSPDVLFSGACSHGLSGSLKYYLGMLDEKDGYVVIDSVAGADMLNYGLYSGIDAVIGVIEPHRNSVKVFEQIKNICRKTMIPCYAVINKPSDNEFYRECKEKYGDSILGEVPLDNGILNYAFEKLQDTTIQEAEKIITRIDTLKKRGNLFSIQ